MATREEFLASLPVGNYGGMTPEQLQAFYRSLNIYDAQGNIIGQAGGGSPTGGQGSSAPTMPQQGSITAAPQNTQNQYFIDDNGDLKVIRVGDEDGTPQRPTADEREEYAMSDPSRQRLVRNGVEYGIANPADFNLSADDPRVIQEGGQTWLPTALMGQLLAPFKHDSWLEQFLTELPQNLAIAGTLAGVTGGLGALQGIPNNGLVNLSNIFNPTETDASWGVNPAGTEGVGAENAIVGSPEYSGGTGGLNSDFSVPSAGTEWTTAATGGGTFGAATGGATGAETLGAVGGGMLSSAGGAPAGQALGTVGSGLITTATGQVIDAATG